MSVPFLLIAAAMIFAMGGAGNAASLAAIQARHDAWSRPASSEAPLDWSSDPEADLVSGRAEVSFSLSRAVASIGNRAEATHGVLSDPWDFRAVPFAPQDFLMPHQDELRRLVRGAPSALPAGALDLDGLDALTELGRPGESGDLRERVAQAGSGVGLSDFAVKVDEIFSKNDQNSPGQLAGVIDKLLKVAGGGGTFDKITDALAKATGLPIDQVTKLKGLTGNLDALDGQQGALRGLLGGDSGGGLENPSGLGGLNKGLAQSQDAALKAAAEVMLVASRSVDPMRDLVDQLASLASKALDLIGLGDHSDEIKETADGLKKASYDPFRKLYDAAHGR